MKRNILLIAAVSAIGTLLPATALFAADAAANTAPPATQPATSSDVAALVHQLGDDDFHVRQAAADKLKQMGKDAVPALQEARKSTDPEVHAKADELLQEIDRPLVQAVPKATGTGSHSMRVSIVDGAKTVDVQEPGRTIHIEEDGNGIAMKVTGQIDGKEVTREYKAKNADQLKKEDPEAFALYQQNNGGGNAGGVQFQVGGGLRIQGNIQIQRGNGIIIGPNVRPGLIQPGQIQPGGGVQPPVQLQIKPMNPTGDDLDKLENKILDQMKAGNTPDAQQEEVKGMLKQLRDALPKAENTDKDLNAQMQEYNRKSDDLRKELSALKLPDPGDALPPPSWGRLGISATEETIAGRGLVITHVLPDSRAEKIGLKEQDAILKVNGQDIHTTRELRKAVTENARGLVVEGLRDGNPFKLEEPAAGAGNPKPE